MDDQPLRVNMPLQIARRRAIVQRTADTCAAVPASRRRTSSSGAIVMITTSRSRQLATHRDSTGPAKPLSSRYSRFHRLLAKPTCHGRARRMTVTDAMPRSLTVPLSATGGHRHQGDRDDGADDAGQTPAADRPGLLGRRIPVVPDRPQKGNRVPRSADIAKGGARGLGGRRPACRAAPAVAVPR
jgi:hypothetical protein